MENIKKDLDIVKESKNSYKAWTKIHLSILDNWDSSDWDRYNKSKKTYFIYPYKWTIVATGKTKKEATENAKDIISRYRN